MSPRSTLMAGLLVLLFAGLQAADDAALLEQLRKSKFEILHETYEDDNWEIYVRKADGSDPRNLTRTKEVHELYPRASPDGRRIAFVSDETVGGKKVRSVYFMKRDGTGRTLVARNTRQPCWSPDGQVIAYLEGEFSRFNVSDYVTKSIVFHDVTTGKKRRHPNEKLHHLYNICWSADGQWILATVHGGMGYGHAILAIEVDGQGVHDLKINGCRPEISPDGKKLCWGWDDHTISVGDLQLEGPRPRVVNIRNVVKDKQHVYHSDWSPDGRFISFSHGPGGRVLPDGPGTNKGLAEFVGVRATWDLYVVDASDDTSGDASRNGGRVRLTRGGQSNKESEWLTPPSDSIRP